MQLKEIILLPFSFLIILIGSILFQYFIINSLFNFELENLENSIKEKLLPSVAEKISQSLLPEGKFLDLEKIKKACENYVFTQNFEDIEGSWDAEIFCKAAKSSNTTEDLKKMIIILQGEKMWLQAKEELKVQKEIISEKYGNYINLGAISLFIFGILTVSVATGLKVLKILRRFLALFGISFIFIAIIQLILIVVILSQEKAMVDLFINALTKESASHMEIQNYSLINEVVEIFIKVIVKEWFIGFLVRLIIINAFLGILGLGTYAIIKILFKNKEK